MHRPFAAVMAPRNIVTFVVGLVAGLSLSALRSSVASDLHSSAAPSAVVLACAPCVSALASPCPAVPSCAPPCPSTPPSASMLPMTPCPIAPSCTPLPPEGAPNPAGNLGADVLLYSDAGHNHQSAAELQLPDAGLAFATKRAQEWIYRHQHPESCAGKKFIVSRWGSGFGSFVHVSTWHMAIALTEGRIFLWDAKSGHTYVDDATCGGVTNVLCFFRSPSSCTLADTAGLPEDDVYFPGPAHELGYTDVNLVPPALLEMYLAEAGPAAVVEAKYWWRAQGAAYLMRLNSPTLAAVRELRKKPLVSPPVNDARPETVRRWPSSLHSAFPLPRGVVSIHVRHGDKGREMTLVPSSVYLEAAETYGKVAGSLGTVRAAFISTEDPGVLEAATAIASGRDVPPMSRPRTERIQLATAAAGGLGDGVRGVNMSLPGGSASALESWAWLWVDIPRDNSNGDHQMDLFEARIKRGVMTQYWLLNLLIALECDVWIGARGSNWNRLIDELRCIWVAKCAHPYVEVGDDDGGEGATRHFI